MTLIFRLISNNPAPCAHKNKTKDFDFLIRFTKET